jgi:DNA-binding transcriptional MerR regulator
MIPTKILREKTGLTSTQLYHLRKLGLIPKPTRIPTIGHGGSTYAYPATVLNRIRLLKILQAKGIPLTQIARQATGTPFACVDAGRRADGEVRE